MTAFTFTADHTTDQLVKTGHGLLTGDGPIVVRNEGGALPTGLASLTEYWAIRIDADTYQLAASSSDAHAGTFVGFSDDGTGTHTLEIGIPYVRARTYVPRSVDVAGSKLKSADLNALMDSFKALHRLVTGQAQSIWTGIKLAAGQHIELQGAGTVKHGTHKLILNGSPIVTAGSVSSGVDGLGGFCSWILAVSTTAYIRIDGLRYCGAVNSKITAVRVFHSGPLTNSDSLTVALSRVVSTTGTKTDEGSTGGAVSPTNITGLSRATFGNAMYVKLSTTANSDYGIRYIEIDYEMAA